MYAGVRWEGHTRAPALPLLHLFARFAQSLSSCGLYHCVDHVHLSTQHSRSVASKPHYPPSPSSPLKNKTPELYDTNNDDAAANNNNNRCTAPTSWASSP